jgi:PAT family beta-lactamase induction signal transducer AmpG
MQGIPSGFALTAIANFLAAKGLSSYSVGSFVAIVGIPWALQFVWGPIIDRYQYSVIGHRKHWVVLTQIMAVLASLTLLLVNDPVSQLSLMSLVFLIHSIFASIQDASVDAIAISIVPEQERGRVNAFMRGGYLFGIALGSAGLSTVLLHYGFFYAAATQSVALLLMTVLTFIIKLDGNDRIIPMFVIFGSKQKAPIVHRGPDLKTLFTALFKGITSSNNLKTFLIIALVYTCMSFFIRSFSFHLIHSLHWPYNHLSVLQGGWGILVTIIVILSGGVVADKIGPSKLQFHVMLALGIFLILFSSFYNFWDAKAFSTTGLIIWNFADPMFSVAAMPVLMMLCHKNVEGSQFTAYMAIVNLCDVIGSYVSGVAMTHTSAQVIGFSCGLIIFSASFFIRRIR